MSPLGDFCACFGMDLAQQVEYTQKKKHNLEASMTKEQANADEQTHDVLEAGIEELTLALLYLKRFKWNKSDHTARASLRSFDWDTLDNLLKSADLSGCDRQAVWISDKGLDRARDILEKYGLSHLEASVQV